MGVGREREKAQPHKNTISWINSLNEREMGKRENVTQSEAG
jgi:hypothetical protein